MDRGYFNLEIDRHLSLGPSWMAISDYLGGYLLTKTHHFCCILFMFSLFIVANLILASAYDKYLPFPIAMSQNFIYLPM